jgi:twitching motility protein PilT
MATLDPATAPSESASSSSAPAAAPASAPASAASTPPVVIEPVGLEIDRLFEAMVKLNGSDLHLKVDKPPYMRVKGALQPLKYPPIGAEQMKRLCAPIMNERQRGIFDTDGGADFAHTCVVDGVRWRFRINMLTQQGAWGLVARRVNNTIPDFEKLFLPPSIERLCQLDQGMVLLAGVTGSGKSTTIGSMLNYINRNYRKHILTLEDPIEFVFTEDKCLINQREIGQDVKDFGIGMKHAVREDPDIILVGEMRDEETFMTAIHAAETGHLVFGTIHAASASTTIGRILDLFPEEMHGALRSAIANNMKGIVGQKLIRSEGPRAKELGLSRVPVVEIMFFDVMVRKMVLEGQDSQLPDHIKKSYRDGMQDFTMSLKSLIDKDLVERKDALEIAPNREALMMALKGIGVS